MCISARCWSLRACTNTSTRGICSMNCPKQPGCRRPSWTSLPTSWWLNDRATMSQCGTDRRAAPRTPGTSISSSDDSTMAHFDENFRQFTFIPVFGGEWSDGKTRRSRDRDYLFLRRVRQIFKRCPRFGEFASSGSTTIQVSLVARLAVVAGVGCFIMRRSVAAFIEHPGRRAVSDWLTLMCARQRDIFMAIRLSARSIIVPVVGDAPPPPNHSNVLLFQPDRVFQSA